MGFGTTRVDAVYAGGMGCLEPEGQRSGIFKESVPGRVRVGKEGLNGDEHADTRVHGGPEKAVHQYAAENYKHIAATFPHRASLLLPGTLGENISAHNMTEVNVHIGDVIGIGTAVLQVSQPRSPCWKINHRFGEERMSAYVAQARITGWYYRVLEPGEIQAEDSITLLERNTDRFSIDQFWQVQVAHRPSLDDLADLAAVRGLAPQWKHRLEERMKWLGRVFQNMV